MALPKLSIQIEAVTDDAERGLRRTKGEINSLANTADSAASRMSRFGASMNASRRPARNYGFAVQNASFQMADFAVQVEMGTNAARALGQQLPQLLGGFGVYGAILGAVVAISIPLVKVFGNLSDSGRDLSGVVGTLGPMFGVIGDAMSQIATLAVSFADIVVNNLDRIIITAGVAASFFGAKMVGAFIAARIATFSLAGALTFLRGALIRTGFGALIVAAGEMVYQFTRLVTAAGGFGEAMVLVKAVAIGVLKRIGEAVVRLPDMFKIASLRMTAFFVSALGTMMHGFIEFTWAVAEGLNNLFGTDLMGASGVITQEMNRVVIAAEDAANALSSDVWGDLSGPIEGVAALRETLAGLNDERVDLAGLFSGSGDGEEEGGDGSNGESAASKKIDKELTAQEERVKQHFDRIKALSSGGLSDKLGAWSDYFSNLATLTGSSNDKLLKVSKAFAASMALLDAWRAYTQTIADPTLPWYAKLAAGAQVLAAGMGAVNAIKSVSSSGGSSASAGGGASTAAAGGASAGGSQGPLDVRVTGLGMSDIVRGSDVASLFDMLNQEAGDRGLNVSFAQ